MTRTPKKERDLDWHRELAAFPLPNIVFECTQDDVWTVRDGERFTWTWCESDMPHFAAWLWSRLNQLHGTLKVAATELGVVEKKRRGGTRTAAIRKAEAHKRNAALTAAAKAMLASSPGLSNSDLARMLAERGHGGFASLRRKLPDLLKKPSRR